MKEGDKVRVKAGVVDPDFPDMVLGGITGVVDDVFDEGRVSVALDAASIERLGGEAYKERCRDRMLSDDFVTVQESELELQ